MASRKEFLAKFGIELKDKDCGCSKPSTQNQPPANKDGNN